MELIIPLVILLVIIYLIRASRSSRKHKLKIKQATRVLNKVKSIDSNAGKLNYLKKIDPYVFEELLLTAFDRKGYVIERNKSYSGDGGLDGKVFFKGEKYLIQAKRYKQYIKYEHVRDFIYLTQAQKCKGYFVHTGKTPDSVRRLLDQNPSVIVISGIKLIQLIAER